MNGCNLPISHVTHVQTWNKSDNDNKDDDIVIEYES